MTMIRTLKVIVLSAFVMLGIASQAVAQCSAEFEYQAYDGPMPVVGGITFTNLSTGPYTGISWDFGDGSYFSTITETVDHFYSESGTYTVHLSVWNNNPGECYADYQLEIDVQVSDDPCDQLDCVWPGDANGDSKANLEDLLNIGYGFQTTGPPRDEVDVSWTGHIATDWPQSTADGVNYKHLDCNGDGIINEFDILPVNMHYVTMENGVSITESGGAPLSLEFDIDTFIINEDTPETVEINAALLFGHDDFPLEDVYGVVFYLEYPEEYIDSASQVTMEYNQNSFFGDLSNTLPYARDDREIGQVDAVVTRKNGLNTSGQGRLANFKFIIDIDIIDGRAVQDEETQFKVNLNVVKAIDGDGNEIDVSLPEDPACVTFISDFPNSNKQPDVSDQINVYPNPATDLLQINTNDLKVQEMSLFNALGQQVIHRPLNGRVHDINVSALQAGVYLLHVQSEEGLAIKRIVIN